MEAESSEKGIHKRPKGIHDYTRQIIQTIEHKLFHYILLFYLITHPLRIDSVNS